MLDPKLSGATMAALEHKQKKCVMKYGEGGVRLGRVGREGGGILGDRDLQLLNSDIEQNITPCPAVYFSSDMGREIIDL